MRTRQQHPGITLTNAAAGANGSDVTDPLMQGLIVGINITSITGTAPTLTVTIQGKDEASGTYYTILASTALNAAGYTELIVHPGTTAAANLAVSRPMPRTYRISTVVGGGTPAVTATISAQSVN